jgi:hypothetical protein
MQLQLLSQDVQYSLQDVTDTAFVNMPKNMRELQDVTREAATLQAETDALREQLQKDGCRETAPQLSVLTELDAIKLRAEECMEKLQQAESLDKLRLQVSHGPQRHEVPASIGPRSQIRTTIAVVEHVPMEVGT